MKKKKQKKHTKLIWVIINIQQPERFAESHLTDNVEGHELELLSQVENAAVSRVLIISVRADEPDQLAHARVDISLECEILSTGILC